MVYGAASNNSACIALQTTAEETCLKAADYCDSVGSTVSFATTLIALPIIVLAGQLFLEGTTNTVLMFRDLGKWCSRNKDVYRPLDDELDSVTIPIEKDVSQSEKVETKRITAGWKRAIGATKMLTTAVALGAIAIVALEFSSLFSQENCYSMKESCVNFSVNTVEACNWVDLFLVNVINEAIQHYLHH